MPVFRHGDISIYYEEYGQRHGFPILLIAPGGMRSVADFWHRSPFDPTVALAADFRVIAMDQRNAGQSRAPIGNDDGWQSYVADQLALLDYLKIKRFHVMGGCIGCAYGLALIETAPERVVAGVLQNPIGLSNGNRPMFQQMFDEWAVELHHGRPEIDKSRLDAFGRRMFGGEFVFSVSREAVRSCRSPLLVLAGDDDFHPTATAVEIADIAPDAELLLSWRTPEVINDTVNRVRSFLRAHTPREF